MIKNLKKIGCVLTLLVIACPAGAKVTIGPLELSLEIKNTSEIMSQIKKMEQIVEFKNTMCSVLGADMCNAISNQIATCTKSALNKIDKDIMDVDKENLIKAANSCAGDLYISECIDAGYDSLNDLAKKQTSLENILNQTDSKDEKLWSNTGKAYTDALTGEKLTDKIDSVADSVDATESLYKQLGGGDVSKSYIGNATQKLFQQATTPTRNMELVKACSMDALSAADWVPSVTTLSASEMAPTVPSQIKSILTKAEEGGSDLISKLEGGGESLSGSINDSLSGITGSFDSGFDMVDTIEKNYNSANSLYNKGSSAVSDIQNADNLDDMLSGVHNAMEVVNDSGIGSYLDPLKEKTKIEMDSGKEVLESSWNVASGSSVGQTVGDVAGGVKDAVEGGSSLAASGVAAVGNKVSEVEQGIASLVLAGMKKATDAGAELILGTPADINEVRENQNQLQINALSSGIGSGLKSSALVGASGEELAERSDKIEMSSDIFNMLKEIAGLSAQSLQKNNAITALKAQLLEMGALDNITAGGVLNQGE